MLGFCALFARVGIDHAGDSIELAVRTCFIDAVCGTDGADIREAFAQHAFKIEGNIRSFACGYDLQRFSAVVIHDGQVCCCIRVALGR